MRISDCHYDNIYLQFICCLTIVMGTEVLNFLQIFAYLCMYLSSPDAQTGIFIICPI